MYLAIEKEKFEELMEYIVSNMGKTKIHYDTLEVNGDWYIYYANVPDGLFYVANRYNIRKIIIDKLRKVVIIKKGSHPSMSLLSTVENEVPVTDALWEYSHDNEKLVKMILFDLLLYRSQTSWNYMSYYTKGETITFL